MSSRSALLATKFFVPTPSQVPMSRHRLHQLLEEGWRRKLTLLSAPAGFGKTTLLAAWIHMLPQGKPLVAWVTLDETDNEPGRFWTYLLAALDQCRPGIYEHLLTFFQEEQALSLEYALSVLINTLAEQEEPVVLVLDDYHVVHEPAIHTSLAYLIEHQPPQLHLMIATQVDPPLPLSRLRARGWLLEIRPDQLRCTSEEAAVFLKEVMHLSVTDDEIRRLQAATEGWIVLLQLAALSLREQGRGENRRYIVDYLLEEVAQRQPTSVQTFLLHTSILGYLSAPLCDAVMEQQGSQQILEYLERANLFVSSLDNEQSWYRCCPLITEAFYHQLERTEAQVIPSLHLRASLWFAARRQTTEAVRHALSAQDWEWAADLIETVPCLFDWGEGEPERVLLCQWLDQLPPEVIHARPRLSLLYAQTHAFGAPFTLVDDYLRTAETLLTPALSAQDASFREKQERLLGEVLAVRAYLDSYYGDGRTTWELSTEALAHLAEEQYVARAQVAYARFRRMHAQGEAEPAACCAREASTLALAAGHTSTAIMCLSGVIRSMLLGGKLHQAWQVSQEAMRLGAGPEGLLVPTLCWILAWRAEILREWNRLDEAMEQMRQAIHLGKRGGTVTFVYIEYTILARISRAQGNLAEASEALQQIENMPARWNLPTFRAIFFTPEQIRLWLERGEGERAARWFRERAHDKKHECALPYEREEVARIRMLLAQNQPAEALSQLTPLLQDAERARRFASFIELLILQACAFQRNHQEPEAFRALRQAIQRAEPEGYVRLFVDEKEPLMTLLSRFREQERKNGPTPYLDTLLTADQGSKQSQERVPAQPVPRQPLLDLLTNRELEVLHLLARGTPNQEMAESLVVTRNTVKRHLSNIFIKLDVSNRTQAVIRAHSLGLLPDDQTTNAG